MRLLLVDTDTFFLRWAKEEIDWEKMNISEIETAYSVENAKTKIQDCKMDVVIASVEMSGENGMELMEWMQKTDARTIRMLVSEREDFKSVVEAMHCGVFAYLKKPFHQKELEKSIQEAEVQIKKYDLQHSEIF